MTTQTQRITLPTPRHPSGEQPGTEVTLQHGHTGPHVDSWPPVLPLGRDADGDSALEHNSHSRAENVSAMGSVAGHDNESTRSTIIISGESESSRKRRRPFLSECEREETALIRKFGACENCRKRKLRVSYHDLHFVALHRKTC
jgi:hypothetical protein